MKCSPHLRMRFPIRWEFQRGHASLRASVQLRGIAKFAVKLEERQGKMARKRPIFPWKRVQHTNGMEVRG